MITAPGIIWETGPELISPGRAAFDDGRLYRYQLTRTWNPAWPAIIWLMLNPSTAGAFTDDATITRCTAFARANQAGGITVVNLFAYRATRPADLRQAADPVGPLNDLFILEACRRPGVVVVAWGTHGGLRGRAAAVTRLLTAAGVRPLCLGTTRDGYPRHPLYVPGATPLQPYREPSCGQ